MGLFPDRQHLNLVRRGQFLSKGEHTKFVPGPQPLSQIMQVLL